MTIGIYCIENKTNGKRYIGSSVNIEDRWIHHKSKLRTNKHNNIHLQRAYNKNEEKNFIYSIIEKCGIKKLEHRENFFINLYRTIDEDFGYNKKWSFGRKKNGTERTNTPMLQSVKDKLSKALKGRPKSEKWKKKVRKPKSEEGKLNMGKGRLFKKLNVNRSSNYIGVYKNKNNKWIAQIRIDKERIYIGIYNTEMEAAKAFDIKYCKNYNKKFGLNFPDLSY